MTCQPSLTNPCPLLLEAFIVTVTSHLTFPSHHFPLLSSTNHGGRRRPRPRRELRRDAHRLRADGIRRLLGGGARVPQGARRGSGQRRYCGGPTRRRGRLPRQARGRRVRPHAGVDPAAEWRRRFRRHLRRRGAHCPGLRHAPRRRRARVHVLPQPQRRHAPHRGRAQPRAHQKGGGLPLRIDKLDHGAMPVGAPAGDGGGEGSGRVAVVRPQPAAAAVAIAGGGAEADPEYLGPGGRDQGERGRAGVPHRPRLRRGRGGAAAMAAEPQASARDPRRQGLQVLHQGFPRRRRVLRRQAGGYDGRRRRLRRRIAPPNRGGQICAAGREEAKGGAEVCQRLRSDHHHQERCNPFAANCSRGHESLRERTKHPIVDFLWSYVLSCLFWFSSLS